LAWGCGLDSTVSGQGPVAGCCECGDEPSGSCATELVSYSEKLRFQLNKQSNERGYMMQVGSRESSTGEGRADVSCKYEKFDRLNLEANCDFTCLKDLVACLSLYYD
jgi:hypothetical protein